MLKPFRLIFEFFRIILRRVREQGIATTWSWLRAVGTPWLTGRISLRYSKVTDNVYIGSQYGELGKKVLAEAGITATVNMRAEYNDEDFGLTFAEYSYLPTVDNTAPTLEHLSRGVEFIKRIIDDGGTVYVHCGSGVGRAPTAVAAYLIAEEGLSVADAISKIKEARPFIRVLPAQVERLHEFRHSLGIVEPEELPVATDSPSVT